MYKLGLSSGDSLAVAIDRPSGRVRMEGSPLAVRSAADLIQTLDRAGQSPEDEVSLCTLNRARKGDIATVAAAFQANQPPAAPGGVEPPPPPTVNPDQPMATDRPAGQTPQAEIPREPTTTEVVPMPGAIPGQPDPEQEGLLGPVQIEILEGLDVLVIRGHKRDVERVRQVIEQIEQLSAETKPVIRILPLRHVESAALAALLQQVYAEVFATRLGALSITALGKPNAILLIGREETVMTAVDLTRRLDQPVAPSSQFQVFRLKNIPAESAVESIEAFFAQQQQQQAAGQTGSLSPRVQVVADFRSNSVIVRGNPRELAEVAAMLQRIDLGVNAAVNQVQVFKLKNALAETLAPVLQDAITGQIYGQRTSRGQFGIAQAAGGQQRQDFERKSSRLQFVTVDPQGRQVLNSGILTDAQVTADSRTNALVVTASTESMPLIAALVQQLDQPAEIEAQVKVFTLVNSDATAMAQMLEQIFAPTGAAEGLAVRTGVPIDDTSLVGLRFAVDARTNSIIVTGSTGALTVVEAILLRLDDSDFRNRKTSVYRLKNAPATDVAVAVNEYLQGERQVEQIAPELMTAFQQFEREVVVVAEPVSNSLIISATPRFYEEILKLVEEIDRRPPMVMIQVLIAEVRLDDTCEFGVELGLQDSILFDRSAIIGSNGAGILSPGFLFNSGVIGNSASDASLATRENVGGQAITNLGVGRTNTDLGFGGLVLSASSESVSVLVRALQQQHRLEILSRPQVMTMDNQTAQILVGQQVPTIQATQLTQFGVVNSVVYRDVGLIVTVTPRISPDNLVVMEIQAEKSAVGPIAEGIPIAITDSGETIRSPRIDSIITRTVVSAVDGQTVVLGGMIQKDSTLTHRKVPYLAEIPVLGHLFRYKFEDVARNELLIIMTPRIVDDVEDAEKIKRIEAARMHWCLCDVMALHDGDGLGARGPSWFDGNAAVIYPDLDPTLKSMQQLVPPGDGTNTMITPEVLPTPLPGPPAGPAMPAPGMPPETSPPPATAPEFAPNPGSAAVPGPMELRAPQFAHDPSSRAGTEQKFEQPIASAPVMSPSAVAGQPTAGHQTPVVWPSSPRTGHQTPGGAAPPLETTVIVGGRVQPQTSQVNFPLQQSAEYSPPMPRGAQQVSMPEYR